MSRATIERPVRNKIRLDREYEAAGQRERLDITHAVEQPERAQLTLSHPEWRKMGCVFERSGAGVEPAQPWVTRPRRF